jgi:hypothetical protein
VTAINIIRQTGAVHMITDGLSAGGIVSKAMPIPHLNAVIAATGVLGAGLHVAAEANQADSYDDLKASIGQIMRHCEAMYPKLMKTKARPDYEIYCAGISETSGPDFYYAANHKRRADVASYTATCPGGSSLIQPCTKGIADEIMISWQGRCTEALDPLIEGPRMIEIQRAHLNSAFPDQIGGLCTVSTVTAESITQRVARRWPLHLDWEFAA